jgi:hypothetical protein
VWRLSLFLLLFTLKMKSEFERDRRLPQIGGIEQAPREITAFGGLRAFYELVDALGLEALVEESLSIKQRQRGYDDSTFVLALMAVHLIGGDGLDDLQRLRGDAEFMRINGLEVPACNTAADYLRKATPGHIRQFEKMMPEVLRRIDAHLQLARPRVSATVDADSTHAIVYGHQQGADRLHTGEVGFHPLFAFDADREFVLHAKLRRGHAASSGPAEEAIAFIAQAFANLPEQPLQRFFRADAGFYSIALMNWLIEQGIGFAITARVTKSVRDEIAKLDESAWTLEPGGKGSPGGTKHRPKKALHPPEIAEFDMEFKTEQRDEHGKKKSIRVRMVVRRRREITSQRGLFADDAAGTTYHVIATNRTNYKAKALLDWADGRGNCENFIKELKNDFDALGCGQHQFNANAAWMHIGLLAYNLMCALRLLAGAIGHDQAARWRTGSWRTWLFAIPAYLVRSGRNVKLKLAAALPLLHLFSELVRAITDTT